VHSFSLLVSFVNVYLVTLFPIVLFSAQVHIRLWICRDKVTCGCAVAIREGKDVIVLSICNELLNNEKTEPTQLIVNKTSPGRLSRGIHISKKIRGRSLEHEVYNDFSATARIPLSYHAYNNTITIIQERDMTKKSDLKN
jgi:hypothetical protein